jgi:DNA-binding transcriptional regulator LsrR (DeoR family)
MTNPFKVQDVSEVNERRTDSVSSAHMSADAERSTRGWGPARRLQAEVVARRFHEDGRTKVQIANELGISRFKVARILESAHLHGLVRIELSAGDDVAPDLSERVRRAYRLRRAVVAARPRGPEQPAAARARLASLSAALVEELVTPGEVLGLAWARTVNDMVEVLHQLPQCTVVQLCGVYSRLRRGDRAVDTVRRAAALCGGTSFPIFAPLLLPDRRTAAALRRQPGIAEAFDQFAQVSTAVVAIGGWRTSQSTVFDVLPEAKRLELAQAGVRGELAAHLFDADGRLLDTGLSHHVLAIGADELRAVPEVIALAGGRAKAEAIDAVLRSGLVSTVVTDSAAAEEMLTLTARRPAAGAGAT